MTPELPDNAMFSEQANESAGKPQGSAISFVCLLSLVNEKILTSQSNAINTWLLTKRLFSQTHGDIRKQNRYPGPQLHPVQLPFYGRAQESYMTKRTLLYCFGAVSLFLPISLMAQKDAASLEGRVVDARGAVVAQASVT